jgi:HAE1 family hydrophobic/amphiphilic exporter-1
VLVSAGAAAPAAQQPAPPAAASAPPRVGVTPGLETPLSLEDLIARVLQENPQIRAARVDRESAEFSLQVARGLFEPRVTADWSYERRISPVSSSLGGAADGQLDENTLQFAPAVAGLLPWFGGSYQATFSSTRSRTDSAFVPLDPQFPTALSFSFVQPLARGLHMDSSRRQLRIAQVTRALTDAQFRQQVTDIMAGAARAYWDLVFAVENLDVQQDALAEAREHVAGNRRMADQGLLSAMDVVEAEAQVAIFEGNVAAAQEAVTRVENALKSLMLPDRASPLWGHALTPITRPPDNVPRLPVEEAVQTALAKRPEREQLDRSADINRINTRFFRDQARPQIDLIASYTLSGLAGAPVVRPGSDIFGGPADVPPFLVGGYRTSLGTLFERDFPTAHVGLRLTLPVWNRSAEAGVALALADERRLEHHRAQLDQTIEAEVRNAMQALRSAEAQLAAASAGRAAAEQQYASEERRLEAGISTVYLVFERHSALVAARGRELQARTELRKAVIEFERVTGTALERHGISVDSN